MSLNEGDDNTMTPGSAGIDRRSLIRKAAIGGTAVWAAPQILTVTAAGAQSGACIPDGLAWSDFEIDVDALPSGSFDAPIANGGTVTVAYTAGGGSTVGYATVAPLGGVFSSFATLGLAASAPAEFTELTLTFSVPVEDLSFTILDLDLGDGFWQDQIQLEASLAATPVLLGAGDVSFNATLVASALLPPANQFTAISDPSGIGSGTANSSADANVAVTYPSAVDTLVIRYLAGPAEATPQPQQIGVGDLTFCVTT